MHFYRVAILLFIFSFCQVMGSAVDGEMPFTVDDMASAKYVMDHHPGLNEKTMAKFINAQDRFGRSAEPLSKSFHEKNPKILSRCNR